MYTSKIDIDFIKDADFLRFLLLPVPPPSSISPNLKGDLGNKYHLNLAYICIFMYIHTQIYTNKHVYI
jgi:hypothetical protein